MSDDLTRLAWHESGHLLVGHLFNAPARSVSIEPGFDSKLGVDYIGRVKLFEVAAPAVMLRIFLAGALAEQLAPIPPETIGTIHGEDLESVGVAASMLADSPERAARIVREAVREVRALLSDHKPALALIAEAIGRHGTMSAIFAAETVGTALAIQGVQEGIREGLAAGMKRMKFGAGTTGRRRS